MFTQEMMGKRMRRLGRQRGYAVGRTFHVPELMSVHGRATKCILQSSSLISSVVVAFRLVRDTFKVSMQPRVLGRKVESRASVQPAAHQASAQGETHNRHCIALISPLFLSPLSSLVLGSGLLPQGHRDTSRFCSGLEQPWLCIQRSRGDLAGHTPL